MKRISVSSSMLKSVGYESLSQMLEVEFSNGDVWQYVGVPQGVWNEMMESSSVGSYFHKNTKGNFTGTKVS